MASFRENLLPILDRIRALPGALDLRTYQVTVRVRDWTGARAGLGTKTDTDTVLLNGGKNVRVREVPTKDVVASGGLYTQQDLKVGPFTPDWSGGGIDEAIIDPVPGSSPREVFFKVTGSGMGNGRWYKRIHDETLPNFSRILYLRAIGTAAP